MVWCWSRGLWGGYQWFGLRCDGGGVSVGSCHWCGGGQFVGVGPVKMRMEEG